MWQRATRRLINTTTSCDLLITQIYNCIDLFSGGHRAWVNDFIAPHIHNNTMNYAFISRFRTILARERVMLHS